MEYRSKIVDGQLDLRMEAFGAVQIVGPKGCGKTTTAKQRAKTIIEFQDEDKRDRYLQVAEEMPSRLLRGEKPVLFDEWQDARPQDDHNRPEEGYRRDDGITVVPIGCLRDRKRFQARLEAGPLQSSLIVYHSASLGKHQGHPLQDCRMFRTGTASGCAFTRSLSMWRRWDSTSRW